MNHPYNVDLLDNNNNGNSFINMTTFHVFSTTSSLQTDPDLYALKSKRKNHEVKNTIKEATTNTTTHGSNSNHLVSTNRLAYVEALVDINAVVIESIWYPNTTTTATSNQKESRVSPVVPLRTFIQEVLKRSRTTYSTLQTALFYLFRARPSIIQHLQQQQQQKSWQHNAYISCGRRMFLASLVVASKFVQDKTYRNSAWAKIAGLPVTEINTAERYFLSMMDYRLYIDQPTFDRWHRLLHIRTQARMHNIPTSLRDLSCLFFAPPTSYPPTSPIINTNYITTTNDIINNTPTNTYTYTTSTSSSSSYYTTPSPSSISSTSSVPPALSLSLPSSISSSPAQTPTQISPVRHSQKRKHDSREHITLLDKKHCRFWQ